MICPGPRGREFLPPSLNLNWISRNLGCILAKNWGRKYCSSDIKAIMAVNETRNRRLNRELQQLRFNPLTGIDIDEESLTDNLDTWVYCIVQCEQQIFNFYCWILYEGLNIIDKIYVIVWIFSWIINVEGASGILFKTFFLFMIVW